MSSLNQSPSMQQTNIDEIVKTFVVDNIFSVFLILTLLVVLLSS
jgi:hypothetical protein